jgi:predicted acetyltransferase
MSSAEGLRIAVPATFREVEELSDVITRVFHGGGRGEWWERWVACVGQENLALARRGDRVVGGFGVFRAGLWFGGRALPVGGVAAVAVRPEERGAGVGRALMAWHLHDLHERGVPLSVLYPATVPFYRRFGYELAGSRTIHRLSTSALDLGERGLACRTYEIVPPKPPPVVADLYQRAAERSAGFFARSDGLWRRLLESADTHVQTAIVGPGDAPEGYVVWEHEDTREIWVRDAVALTPRALARILTLLSDFRTLEESVHWPGPPVDLRLLGLPVRTDRETFSEAKTWMLRIVRVAEALRGRGYVRGLAGSTLELEIEDPLLPDNAGRWTLHFREGGRAEITRGSTAGAPCIRVSIEALAPLYSGFWSASALAGQGLVEGESEALAFADRAFAGPHPWMSDSF